MKQTEDGGSKWRRVKPKVRTVEEDKKSKSKMRKAEAKLWFLSAVYFDNDSLSGFWTGMEMLREEELCSFVVIPHGSWLYST